MSCGLGPVLALEHTRVYRMSRSSSTYSENRQYMKVLESSGIGSGVGEEPLN
jgi:hypothetical protein